MKSLLEISLKMILIPKEGIKREDLKIKDVIKEILIPMGIKREILKLRNKMMERIKEKQRHLIG